MKILTAFLLFAGLTPAQSPTIPGAVPPGPNSPKVVGSPTYVKLSFDTAGARILEPIVSVTNVTETRSTTGALSLQGGITPAQLDSGWVVLTKANPQPSGNDPWVGWEEWCGGSTPGGYAAWMQAQVTLTQVTGGGLSAMSWTFQEEGIVNNLITSSTAITSVHPPVWVKNRTECGGTPALMLTPTATAFNNGVTTPPIPTYVRTSVQVVVVQ